MAVNVLITQRDDTRYNVCNFPAVRVGVGSNLLQHSDMLEVEWTETLGKLILNFLLHFSELFFLIQSVPRKRSAINCIAYIRTEETLSYTMLHTSVTHSRLHWNLWIRWFNVNISAMIRLAVCELCSDRVIKSALSAISRQEFQTVFKNHFTK